MTTAITQQPVDMPSMPGMGQSRSLGAQISPSSKPIMSTSISDKRSTEETAQSNLSKVILQATPTGDGDDFGNNAGQEQIDGDNPQLIRKHNTERTHLSIKNSYKKRPDLKRTHSAPDLKKYDDCREFDSFSGEWIDSKGQTVLISPWGVIRYPNNPKLRFEAIYMGPNHLSVTFDKDPKRRKFVGKLNHECELLIWSNDTKWAKKGCKHDPRFQVGNNKNGKKNADKDKVKVNPKDNKNNNGSCLIQ